jgi:hypothetical protein
MPLRSFNWRARASPGAVAFETRRRTVSGAGGGISPLPGKRLAQIGLPERVGRIEASRRSIGRFGRGVFVLVVKRVAKTASNEGILGRQMNRRAAKAFRFGIFFLTDQRVSRALLGLDVFRIKTNCEENWERGLKASGAKKVAGKQHKVLFLLGRRRAALLWGVRPIFMEAVILAGGQIPLALRTSSDAPERALIPLNGRTLLDHVLDSLRQTAPISGIICVTTPLALAALPSDVRGLPAGDLLTENLFQGARAAQSERILVVTGDVPLATSQTWMQFVEGAGARSLDAAYPIVSKTDCDAQFPGGKRTYAPLKEEQFTGGNAFLLPRAHLESLESLISQAFAARKNPFALAQMLGAGFIARALSKRLTVGDVETKVSKMIGCRAGAVRMSDAAIAFDIDKAEDLALAARVLRERGKNGPPISSSHAPPISSPHAPPG